MLRGESGRAQSKSDTHPTTSRVDGVADSDERDLSSGLEACRNSLAAVRVSVPSAAFGVRRLESVHAGQLHRAPVASFYAPSQDEAGRTVEALLEEHRRSCVERLRRRRAIDAVIRPLAMIDETFRAVAGVASHADAPLEEFDGRWKNMVSRELRRIRGLLRRASSRGELLPFVLICPREGIAAALIDSLPTIGGWLQMMASACSMGPTLRSTSGSMLIVLAAELAELRRGKRQAGQQRQGQSFGPLVLLYAHQGPTQSAIADRLTADGYPCSQPTVSRLLRSCKQPQANSTVARGPGRRRSRLLSSDLGKRDPCGESAASAGMRERR